jgi:outer membrane biosynthesis protein TonB
MFVPRLQDLIPTRTLTALALGLTLLAAGCHRKPMFANPPAPAPAILAQPEPAPEPQPAPSENPSATPEPAPAANPQPDAPKPKPKPKPRKPVPHSPTQPAPAPPAPAEPTKPVPDNSVQITADVPRAAVQSQTQNAEQLLRNSQGKLARITRSLSDAEQGMLRQAHGYIAQSNQALQAGDIERAYNLAVKASLLANELAK